jgi:hypothetical protein
LHLEVEQEEALPEEALPEEALPEEALLEEAPQEEDLPGEDNHLHSKPKRHNQYPSKLDHAMNRYEEQKLKNSEETVQMPKSS